MATYLYETPSEYYAAGVSSDVRPRREAFMRKLRAGDTLVVNSLGSLGENYAEICEEMRNLMRKRILVRAVNEGLTFDGLAEDVAAQASRDALIGFAAAAAETKKTSKHAAVKPARFPQSNPVKDVRASGFQLGVIGVQLCALALIAWLASFAVSGSHRREPASSSQPATPRRLESLSKSAEPQRYATRDFLSDHASEHALERSGESNGGLSPSPDPPAEGVSPSPAQGQSASQDSSAGDSVAASQPLGFSRDEELRIFSAVGDWRSAKVKDAGFPITVGSTIPPNVHLATFPRSLVRHNPVLRGYKFIVHEKAIFLVVPAERQIVAKLAGPATDVPPSDRKSPGA